MFFEVNFPEVVTQLCIEVITEAVSMSGLSPDERVPAATSYSGHLNGSDTIVPIGWQKSFHRIGFHGPLPTAKPEIILKWEIDLQ